LDVPGDGCGVFDVDGVSVQPVGAHAASHGWG
jgi:hypothetical protein